jgi:hypothetical protein
MPNAETAKAVINEVTIVVRTTVFMKLPSWLEPTSLVTSRRQAPFLGPEHAIQLVKPKLLAFVAYSGFLLFFLLLSVERPTLCLCNFSLFFRCYQCGVLPGVRTERRARIFVSSALTT